MKRVSQRSSEGRGFSPGILWFPPSEYRQSRLGLAPD